MERLEDRRMLAVQIIDQMPAGFVGDAVTSIKLDLSASVVADAARDASHYALTHLGDDGVLGGGDDTRVPVMPRYLDGSTQIELVLMDDLATWYELDYGFPNGVLGDWQVDLLDGTVLQTAPGGATFFVSDTGMVGSQSATRFVVDGRDDDDFVGIVFGLQENPGTGLPENYYLVSWKAGDQGSAERGLVLAKVTGTGTLGQRPDLWNLSADDPHLDILATGPAIGWEAGVPYDIDVAAGPDNSIHLSVRRADDGQILWQVTATDPDRLGPGRFGFYNFSQPNVRYWSQKIGGSLLDGDYQIEVVAGETALRGIDGTPLDGDGDGQPGGNYVGTFSLEIGEPTVAIDLDPASDTGISETDNLTQDNSPTFAVTVNRSGIIELMIGNDLVPAASSYAVGAGSYMLDVPALADGTETIRARFTPDLGNPTEASIAVTIDTTGPYLLIGSATEQAPLFNRSLHFSEALDETFLSIANMVLTGPSGAVPITTISGSAETYKVGFDPLVVAGEYQITADVNIRDLAGNAVDQDQDGLHGEVGEDEPTDVFTLLADETAPAVVSFGPLGARSEDVDELLIEFNEPLLESSLTVADIAVLGPTGIVPSASMGIVTTGPQSYRVTLPVLSSEGTYYVTLGPEITDYAMNPMVGPYEVNFSIDKSGPRIESIDPAGTVEAVLDHVDITVSESLQMTTFTVADVSMTDPLGSAVWIEGITRMESQAYRIAFTPQRMNGIYTITIGPDISDPVGNVMDQDQDGQLGELEEDVFTASFTMALPDLAITAEPVGGTAYQGDSIAITWTVTNQGTATASGPWTDAIWLSSDPQHSADDWLLLGGIESVVSTLGPSDPYARNQVVTIPLDTSFMEGSYYILVTTDTAATVAEADEVNNVVATGPLQILLPPLPDLVVDNVVGPATVMPGEVAEITWSVHNIGSVDADGSWTTEILVSDDSDLGNDQMLRTIPSTGAVTAGDPSGIFQSTHVTIPDIGISGQVRFVVRLATNGTDQIFESNQDNNAAIAIDQTFVPILLTLDIPVDSVAEDATAPIRAILSRTGDTADPLSVTLTSSDPSELTVPEIVVLSAGHSEAAFYLTVIDDGIVDLAETVSITASAAEAISDSKTITVLNVQRPGLTLATAQEAITEGIAGEDRCTITVTRDYVTDSELLVELAVSDDMQLVIPGTVVIPASAASASFEVAALDDSIPELSESVTVRASSANHTLGTVLVMVHDNDLPTLSVHLASSQVSEGAGPLAMAGYVERTEVAAVDLQVRLASSDITEAIVPQDVIIPAGMDRADFFIAAIDDDTVDGTQPVTITALVIIPSCGCGTLPYGEEVSADFEVLDDDGPTLTVHVDRGFVGEGIEDAVAITVERNTDTDQPLHVTLTNSGPNELLIPPAITIPAGEAYYTLLADSLDDGVADGDKTVTVTATADNFTAGSASIIVTDRDLPDLMVSYMDLPDSALTESYFNVSFRITNQGLADAISNNADPSSGLVGTWTDRVFLSTDPYVGDDILVGNYTFSGVVPNTAGMNYYERTVPVRAPMQSGNYWVVVQSDLGANVHEGLETNNLRISAQPVQVDAAYSATVQTDTEVAPAGTPILLYGEVTATDTSLPVPYAQVNIQINVRGYRRTIAAIADESGQFATTWNPLPGEAGLYSIGACHPGVATAPISDSFTLVGFQAQPPTAALEVHEGSSVFGAFLLRNLSDEPLSGMALEILDAPANLEIAADLPSAVLGGLETQTLDFTMTATDPSIPAATLIFRVTSTVAPAVDIPIDVRIHALRSRLVSETEAVNVAALRGAQRTVEFSVTNVGASPTGEIEVQLPDLPWLALATADEMPSLATGESAAVVLVLAPPADTVLTAYQGNLVLATTDGGLSMPFNFRVISNATGDLVVAAVDEYYYFTEASPKLEGARITVRDAVTRENLFSATTDTSGEVTFPELAEGYYTVDVRATDHDSYSTTIFLEAEQVNTVLAYLPVQTVRYVWSVEEVEIEDRYVINVESVFETNVPAPVVTVDPPLIDMSNLLVPGQRMQVDMTFSNHGLISAYDLSLHFGDHPQIQFTPLVDTIGELPAQSRVTVPVLIERLPLPTEESGSASSGGNLCHIPSFALYRYVCVDDHWKAVPFYNTPPLDFECPVPGSAPPLGPIGGHYCPLGTTISITPVEESTDGCLDCMPEILHLMTCIPDAIPGGCIGSGLAGCAIEEARDAVHGTNNHGAGDCMFSVAKGCVYSTGLAAIGGAIGGPVGAVALPLIHCLQKKGRDLYECIQEEQGGDDDDKDPSGDSGLAATGGRTWTFVPPGESHEVFYGVDHAFGGTLGINLDSYFERNGELWDFLEPVFYMYGDIDWWFEATGDAITSVMLPFHNAILTTSDASDMISATERAGIAAAGTDYGIGVEIVDRLVDRWNRTQDYWSQGIATMEDLPEGFNDDFIDAAVWLEKLEIGAAAHDAILAAGFTSPFEAILDAGQTLVDSLLEADVANGVCAQVRLQIRQELVVTRDAFEAVLELENGTESALTDVAMEIVITNDSGEDVTSLFGIPEPDRTGFVATGETYDVASFTTGIASWLLVPSTDCAVAGPTEYFVGGMLRYNQGGVGLTIPLSPISITVLPQPELDLLYFHQRDVYSDDPWTDEIEPSQPFVLAVMVQNHGSGEATDLSITSAQPEIVDNEKGLLVDFKIVGTEVSGQNMVPSLTAHFGDIGPGEIVIGQWLLTSTIQGQFIDYRATFEHVDGLGDDRLSLIKNVEIHELIHAVSADGDFADGMPDFLVNDLLDGEDLPDTLYLSDGSILDVGVASGAVHDGIVTRDDWIVELSVAMAGEDACTYLRMADPGGEDYRLVRVERHNADGTTADLPAANFWQTDRTFIELGQRPLDEDKLHLFDFHGSGDYTLYYEPRDQVAPQVAMLSPVEPNPRQTAVDSIDIQFSEPIDATSLGLEDIALIQNHIPVELTPFATIEQISALTFRIQGLNPLTVGDGVYTLSVDAMGVMDNYGNQGTGIASESWIKGQEAPVVLDILGIAPTPRSAPIGDVEVSFSAPVDPATFTRDDLMLSRDGGENLIDGSVAILHLGGTAFRILGLGDLSTDEGDYTLTIDASAVEGPMGLAGIGSGVAQWRVDGTAPAVIAFYPPMPAQRSTPVSTINVTFSEPLTEGEFTPEDLTLTRDGMQVAIGSPIAIVDLGGASYRITGLENFTGDEGLYTLAIDAAGIMDTAGNQGTGQAVTTWLLDTTTPVPASNIAISPDTGVSATDGRTQSSSVLLQGDLSEMDLSVFVFDRTTGADLGEAAIDGLAFTHPIHFNNAGNHQLQIRVVDAAGNANEQDYIVFVDITNPLVAQVDISDPQVDSILMHFSEPVNAELLITDQSILAAVNLVSVETGQVALEASQFSYDPMARTLELVLTEPLPVGTYELHLDGSWFTDQAGNLLRGGRSGIVVFDFQAFAAPEHIEASGLAIRAEAYSVPALADWNADGLPDLIVGEKTVAGDGKIRVYLNSGIAGQPTFDAFFYAQADGMDLSLPSTGCLGVYPRMFDWDRDGLQDLVLGRGDGTIQVARNESTELDPQFGTPVTIQAGPPGSKTNIDVGERATLEIVDWNNDGKYDLVVGAADGKVRVFLNESATGPADFHSELIVLDGVQELVVPRGRASVAVADLNGDTRKDLVLGNTDGQVLFYANTGSDSAPTFNGYEMLRAGGLSIDLPSAARSRPFLGDFDNDGIKDMLIGAYDGFVRLYLGSPWQATGEQSVWNEGEPGETYRHVFEVMDIDTEPPEITAVIIQDGLTQRAYVDSLRIEFSEDVGLAARIVDGSMLAAMTLTNLGMDADADPNTAIDLTTDQFQYTFDPATGSFVLTWSLDAFAGSQTSLPNGFYRWEIDPDQLTDLAGNRLRGNDAATGTYRFEFHCLQGDVDGNRSVDDQDMQRVNAALGTLPGMADWDPNADLDRDAHVTVLDRFLVFQAIGNGIIPPSMPTTGDYDQDGDTDGDDLDLWEVGFGLADSATLADGDSDGDGDVDGNDFLAWQLGFGNTTLGQAASDPSDLPDPGVPGCGTVTHPRSCFSIPTAPTIPIPKDSGAESLISAGRSMPGIQKRAVAADDRTAELRSVAEVARDSVFQALAQMDRMGLQPSVMQRRLPGAPWIDFQDKINKGKI